MTTDEHGGALYADPLIRSILLPIHEWILQHPLQTL
jgi:hypothetical protein